MGGCFVLNAKSALFSSLLIAALTPLPMIAQPTAQPDLGKQLDMLVNKHAYETKSVQLAWQEGGAIYTILETAANGKGKDIVAYDSASGQRSILISAAQLTPAGATAPLAIDGYSWSSERS